MSIETPAPTGFTVVETAAPAADPNVGTGDIPNGGSDGFDLSAALAKFADKLVASDTPAEQPAAVQPPGQPAPAAPTPAPAPTPQAPAPTPAPEPEDLRARQLAALARRQAELDASKAQLAKQVEDARENARKELLTQFVRNPQKFARDVGLTPEQMNATATAFLGQALGDDAPEEVKQKLRAMELEARLDAFEQSQKSKDEQAKQEIPAHVRARADATEMEIVALAREVPSDLPFLAMVAQDEPSETIEALCAIAVAQINAGGPWPTAREVAKKLNEQLQRDYLRLQRAAQPAVPPASPQAQTPSAPASPPKTLSDADVTTRPSRQPEKLLSDAEYLERALRVAEQGLLR